MVMEMVTYGILAAEWDVSGGDGGGRARVPHTPAGLELRA